MRRSVLVVALVACTPTTEQVATLGPDGRITIPAGSFWMGTDRGASFEGPAHRMTLGWFAIDQTEATNREFAQFVAATGWITTAERVGSSSVFANGSWQVVDRASWRAPEGAASTVAGRDRYPVVHLTFDDAQAYCRWRGGHVPTEPEWERAARGGLDRARFPWGDTSDATTRANTWQGRFPGDDVGDDGFVSTAPVASYAPNGFGLHDVAGNVWEWTDAELEPGIRVIRGGSWLCSTSHCVGYRVAARGDATAAEGTNHIGVRCAYEAKVVVAARN